MNSDDKGLTLDKKTNIGAIMDYMMVIPTEKEAKAFYEQVVTWSLKNWNVPNLECNEPNARKLLNKNLRYWAGKAGRWGENIKRLYQL